MKEGNGGRKQKMKTAEWIRTEREKRGMSRKELGDILGCTAEAVRLWELGKRKPGKKYVSALARIFYLGRETSGETAHNSGSKKLYAACGMEGLLKKSLQLTVCRKKSRIYLRKNLSAQLRCPVEISIHPRNDRELLIREKKDGAPKKAYYSVKLVREISEALETEGNMRFLCIWDEREGGWRAVLLPEMTVSYLWNNMRRQADETWTKAARHKGAAEGAVWKDTVWKDTAWLDTIWTERIFWALCWKYGRLVEHEEIRMMYRLAQELAVNADIFEADEIWYLVLMYASALLDEIQRVQRRCMRAEASLSFDQPLGKEDGYSLHEAWMGGEIPHMQMEIDEFIGRLTGFEKRILSLLADDRDPEDNINFGIGLKVLVREGVQSLRRKAEDYYGKEYIGSLLAAG